ncbi:hypothetical protein BH10ACT8_BH10ACT8_23110 [soil metagenome]
MDRSPNSVNAYFERWEPGIGHAWPRFDFVKPAEAGRGRLLPDRDLSMLAAEWLAAGYDSPALVELASLHPADLGEARSLFEATLTELGHPRALTDEDSWRGHWGFIDWARNQMDLTHSPYAAAQRVLEVIGDVDGLWEPGKGAELTALLNQWDSHPPDRPALNDKIRAHLRAFKPEDLPPRHAI